MTRNKVKRQRDIIIKSDPHSLKIRKEALLEAAMQVKEGENVINIVAKSGHSASWGGDGEETYRRHDYLVVEWEELENDEPFVRINAIHRLSIIGTILGQEGIKT